MKIQDFKVVFICPDHNEKYHLRRLHMEKLLKNIGFKYIEWFKSSTENYPDCLANANIEILQNNLDTPVLIVEDDIEWTCIEDFEFDESWDAVYLGISKWGGSMTENIWCGEAQFSEWSHKSVRVINMLSTHAILYISRKYKETVIELLKKYKNTGYNTDVLLSRIQSEYTIIAPKCPLFFQSSKFNNCGVEDHTKFIISI